jgi:arginine-tRNA-protein transferase
MRSSISISDTNPRGTTRPTKPIDSRSSHFLYESPVNTREFCYRDPSGQLLGAGICDLCPESLSSVYFYHDLQHAHRGLGVFSALYEIETARQRAIPFYYLGFWVEGCLSMTYKAQYRPHEILHPDGVWREVVG